MSYSLDARARAQELYVESGYTFDEVAEETDISVSQLKVWAKEGQWAERRTTFERDFLDLRNKFIKMQLAAVDNALQNPHSQNFLAVSKVMHGGRWAAPKPGRIDKASLFLDFLGGLIEHLKAADQEALRHLEPHLRSYAERIKQGQSSPSPASAGEGPGGRADA